MTKITVERFECDAPKCKDVSEVPLPGGMPLVATPGANLLLPDGWIEFQMMGTTPDLQPAMVHASKPECAALLAAEQVAVAEKATEERQEAQEEQRKAAETAIQGGQEQEQL
jgi:hypothetical protein